MVELTCLVDFRSTTSLSAAVSHSEVELTSVKERGKTDTCAEASMVSICPPLCESN